MNPMRQDHAIEISGLSKRFDLRRKKNAGFLSLYRFGSIRDVLRGRLQADDSKNQLWALRDIDLQVCKGERLGIIGRNGAGKSTLLKILAKVLRPTAGQALIRGQVASLLEMGIGFDRELTVRENVLMYGIMNNVPQRKASARLGVITAFAGLEHDLDTPLHHCPSGSHIRLAFASAVNLQADVLLADEVLAVGDAAFQKECINRILDGSERLGQAVLFVSHDMQAIREVCHRVVWLDKGRIIMQGSPDAVISRYTEVLTGDRGSAPEPGSGRPDEQVSPGKVTHARLVSASGAEIGALAMNAEGFVEYGIRIEPGAERFRMHIGCFHDGRIVFSVTQPWETAPAACQNYQVRLRIPAHFFNELAYEFKGALEAVIGGKNHIYEGGADLSFRVHNANREDSAWGDWPWGRQGYICPKLNWQWKVVNACDLINR